MGHVVYDWKKLGLGDTLKVRWRARGFATAILARQTLLRSASHYRKKGHPEFRIVTKMVKAEVVATRIG